MDGFREWLSDNLRYILLGLAIIVVLVAAFFAVRLVTTHLGDGGSDITKETASETVSASEISTTEAQSTEAEDPLLTDNEDILSTVQKYYNAVASKNMEEIQSLCDSLDDTSKQTMMASPIESYHNISIYYKPGLTDKSYVVYPYYEAKMPNIEQMVPSLGNIYLDTKEDGSLYVVNPKTNEQVAKFMEESKKDSAVQELIARVKKECDEVLASNQDLQDLIERYRQPDTEVDIPDANSVDVEVNKSVTVTGNLNVRSDSREDSELLGSLIPGQTVTRIEVLDNGWSKIRFDDGAGTILEGYVLSDYLE